MATRRYDVFCGAEHSAGDIPSLALALKIANNASRDWKQPAEVWLGSQKISEVSAEQETPE